MYAVQSRNCNYNKKQIPRQTVPINCCLANMFYTTLVKEYKTTLEHTI